MSKIKQLMINGDMFHVVPSIANEIASVQPMGDDISKMFELPLTCTIEHSFGDIIYNFIGGWYIYNGERFISADEIYHINCDMFLWIVFENNKSEWTKNRLNLFL